MHAKIERRGRGEVPKGGVGGNTLRKKGRAENIAPEAVSEEEEGGVGGDEASLLPLPILSCAATQKLED